jgi:hypothetical protein
VRAVQQQEAVPALPKQGAVQQQEAVPALPKRGAVRDVQRGTTAARQDVPPMAL